MTMTFYRLDSTKLSFREYWQWKPGLPFVFLAIQKLLGVRINSGQCSTRPERLLPVDPEALPDSHRVALDPLLAKLSTLNFKIEFFYTVPSKGPIRGAGATLTSPDRLAIALLVHSEPVNVLHAVPPAFVFYSCLGDGGILATSGGLPGLVGAAPEFQLLKLRHKSIEQVWKRHSERTRTKITELQPFRGQNVADAVLRIIQRNFDYNVERGVWVPHLEPVE